MLENKTILNLVKSAITNELSMKYNICGNFEDEEVQEILTIMENEKIEAVEAMYKYITESDKWLCAWDEISAYRDYGIMLTRGGDLKRSDYDVYLKKDINVFEVFIEKKKNKFTKEHHDKLMNCMEEIMQDIGLNHYQDIARVFKFKYMISDSLDRKKDRFEF